MDSVVVYETLRGNTRQIAHAVANVLAEHGTVEVLSVDEANSASIPRVDLLVIGAPTHVWGMSWHWTRRIANRSYDRADGARVGIRDWLRQVGPGHGQAGAAFDTEFRTALGVGAASRAIARRLRRRGYRLIDKPTRFAVETTVGPLCEGELARARQWAGELVRRASIPPTVSTSQR